MAYSGLTSQVLLSCLQVLLASIFRRYALELRLPEEPWVEFPIARPKHGMPARFVATMDAS